MDTNLRQDRIPRLSCPRSWSGGLSASSDLPACSLSVCMIGEAGGQELEHS